MHEPFGPGPGGNLTDGQLLDAVAQAVRTSNLARAADLSSMAIARGLRHPTFFNARAIWLESQGRLRDALGEYAKSRELSPRDPILLNAIGLCLLRLERAPDAIKAFESAIAIDPTVADSHYRKGWCEARLGNYEEAERSYRRAVELRPDYAEALAGLAETEVRKGSLTEARSHVTRALELNPSHSGALVTRAMIVIAEKDFASAESQLRAMLATAAFLSGPHRALALGFLGDALDGQGRYADAFASYRAANEELMRIHGPRFAGTRRIADLVAQLNAYFSTTLPARWSPPDTRSDFGAAGHVFLLGFMRSGTTLLEQILGSSPEVVTMDEREILAAETEAFFSDDAGLDRLANLGAADADQLRADYWQRVRDQGLDFQGRTLIDKQPFHTVTLPLYAKLFPEAKFVFALRDPRDVVFSCFRRQFQLNFTNIEMLETENAAKFYDSVMHLAQLYRQKLKLDLRESRYEDLISDFEPSVRSLCEFVGIAWTDDMRAFHKTAPPPPLRALSGGQVRQPLYSQAKDSWQNYAHELAPILPILKSWVEKFGYDPG